MVYCTNMVLTVNHFITMNLVLLYSRQMLQKSTVLSLVCSAIILVKLEHVLPVIEHEPGIQLLQRPDHGLFPRHHRRARYAQLPVRNVCVLRLQIRSLKMKCHSRKIIETRCELVARLQIPVYPVNLLEFAFEVVLKCLVRLVVRSFRKDRVLNSRVHEHAPVFQCEQGRRQSQSMPSDAYVSQVQEICRVLGVYKRSCFYFFPTV